MGRFFLYVWDLLVKGGMAAYGLWKGISGGDNGALTLLLALMVADYISGVAAALLQRSRHTEGGGLSSRAGWKGLLRKALMLLVILLSHALDTFVGDGSAMFQSAVTWFYLSNEAISLLENLALCGVPIPRRLRAMLEQLQENRGGGESAGALPGADTAREAENAEPQDSAAAPESVGTPSAAPPASVPSDGFSSQAQPAPAMNRPAHRFGRRRRADRTAFPQSDSAEREPSLRASEPLTAGADAHAADGSDGGKGTPSESAPAAAKQRPAPRSTPKAIAVSAPHRIPMQLGRQASGQAEPPTRQRLRAVGKSAPSSADEQAESSQAAAPRWAISRFSGEEDTPENLPSP